MTHTRGVFLCLLLTMLTGQTASPRFFKSVCIGYSTHQRRSARRGTTDF